MNGTNNSCQRMGRFLEAGSRPMQRKVLSLGYSSLCLRVLSFAALDDAWKIAAARRALLLKLLQDDAANAGGRPWGGLQRRTNLRGIEAAR